VELAGLLEHDGACADAGVFADADVAKNLRVAAAKTPSRRVGLTLAVFVAVPPRVTLLIEGDVVADDGGSPMTTPRAVVDEDAACR